MLHVATLSSEREKLQQQERKQSALEGVTLTSVAVARGVVPPVPTFRNSEGLAALVQKKLFRSLSEVGVDGVLIAGSVGEGPTLEPDVREELIALAVETLPDRAVVVGCTGGTVDRALSESRKAADLDAGVALVLPPYYYRYSPAEVTRFFLDVAEASPLPILAYHIPSMTGNPITASTADSIAEHPNVVGIKDSAGDLVSFLSTHRRFAGDDFRVFQGAAPLVPASLAAGCPDTMCTVTGIFPQLEHQLREAIAAGDTGTIVDVSRRICSVVELFRSEPHTLPVNVRAIAQLVGLGERGPSGLFDEPDERRVEQLAHGLDAIGLRSAGGAP